jgi:HD-like signal output (HDOD) protein/CheY-like chemotaxis protein
MTAPQYRALVVDDEPALRNLAVRELSRQGFVCDAACNGLEAKEMSAATSYDVVVTDLRMPEMNGHALAVELLAIKNRPVVVILTGVTEPKLAKDLIARGVDDILFKPVDHGILAAKVRALVERRALRLLADGPAAKALDSDCPGAAAPPETSQSLEQWAIRPADLDVMLNQVAKLVPISQDALNVVNMTSLDSFSTRQVAEAIEHDASLAAELLRIANSAFYSPGGKKVVGLEESVVRIGHKRTGELALAMSALAALTGEMVPWLDIALTWRRSVAAGLAVELLIAQTGQRSIERGLFLSALMHPLGRVVLGTLYPAQYREMLGLSGQHHEALEVYENRVFGQSHAEVMAQVLKSWTIPPEIFQPLKYLQTCPASMAELAEPLRTKVELLKLAVLIGRVAAERWEDWDLVEFPSTDALRRLGVASLADLIGQTRAELQMVDEQKYLLATDALGSHTVPPELACEVTYCNVSAAPFDFLAEILPSMGIVPNRCAPLDLAPEKSAVINCLGVPPERLSKLLSPGSNGLLVTDAADVRAYRRYGIVSALPQSFGALRAACLQMAQPFVSA